MALTDVAIRNARPREKPYKLGDSLGLFLLVQPSGGKLWRLKYRVDGKEKKLAIGTYPEVGLADARRRRDEARELLSIGKDPSREKKRNKVKAQVQAETTFTAIAAEYCAKRRRDGQRAWAASTATRCEYLLSLLNGSIGKLPITGPSGQGRAVRGPPTSRPSRHRRNPVGRASRQAAGSRGGDVAGPGIGLR